MGSQQQPSPDFVYKLCLQKELVFDDKGEWKGTALDIKDNYIHLSTKEEIEKTANLYYSNVSEPVILLKVDCKKLEETGNSVLVWEFVDIRKAYFPHLFHPLLKSHITEQFILSKSDINVYVFPKEY